MMDHRDPKAKTFQKQVLPLHTLLHHRKVSISDHFTDFVLLVDQGGRNWSIAVHCEKKKGFLDAESTLKLID